MLHAAITSFIGMNVGKRILRAWEHIAPAGGCAAHIVTLIAAVEHISLFAPGDSADRSDQPNALAALLTRSGDITRIVHVWGGGTLRPTIRPWSSIAWGDETKAFPGCVSR